MSQSLSFQGYYSAGGKFAEDGSSQYEFNPCLKQIFVTAVLTAGISHVYI